LAAKTITERSMLAGYTVNSGTEYKEMQKRGEKNNLILVETNYFAPAKSLD
jgi:hypothetical protein